MNTVIRSGFLFTCHHVGLSGTNGTYTGSGFATNVDRSSIQWIKLQIDAPNLPLSYYAHGRIFDPTNTAPVYYYYPSIAANCAGDLVLGFSGSGSNSFIGGYFAWGPACGLTADRPFAIQLGIDYFPSDRWGDYSATMLDPEDNEAIWTVQQYAEQRNAFGFSEWGTRVSKIKRKP